MRFMASRKAQPNLPVPALVATVVAYGAAAALLLSALLVPGLALVAACATLGVLLVGAAWLMGRYYAASDACEFSPGDHRRDLAEHAASRPPDHRLSRAAQLRHLSEIRTLTRRLIDAANRVDGSATAPTESHPAQRSTPPVERAERALLESVRSAMTGGLDRGAIRVEGFEQAVSTAVAMSDLAYVVVARMRTRLGASITA